MGESGDAVRTVGHRRRRRRVSGRIAFGSLVFRVRDDAVCGEDRPATVLIHGIGMSHRYLSRLHDVLAADGPVLSIDLPGYGGLPKPDHDLDVPAMGRALGEVIASRGVGPVVLVGHSMGAQWAAEVAFQRPELVTDLVLIGPVADAEHRTLGAQTRALALDTLGETPVANAIVFTDYLRCGPRWYLKQVRHMLRYPLEDRVTAVPMPVLVIRGARDPIAGMRWCRELRDRARSGALVLIPGQHHVAQHSAAKAVAEAIRAHTAARGPAAEPPPAEDDAQTRQVEECGAEASAS